MLYSLELHMPSAVNLPIPIHETPNFKHQHLDVFCEQDGIGEEASYRLTPLCCLIPDPKAMARAIELFSSMKPAFLKRGGG